MCVCYLGLSLLTLPSVLSGDDCNPGRVCVLPGLNTSHPVIGFSYDDCNPEIVCVAWAYVEESTAVRLTVAVYAWHIIYLYYVHIFVYMINAGNSCGLNWCYDGHIRSYLPNYLGLKGTPQRADLSDD